MAIYVNTNVGSLKAQRNLSKTQGNFQKSLVRLSTGMRINSAADDSAGLAISEKFKTQIRSMEQASRNAGDGISLVQTAEAAVEQMGGILDRMRELGVQSSTGTVSDADRTSIHAEFTSLRTELDRIADTTEFNGVKLLDGGASKGVNFQVGTGNTSNDRIAVSITDVRAAELGSGATSKVSGVSVSAASKAQKSLSVLDGAITALSSVRSKLGSTQNRLEITVDNLGAGVESLSAANSRIRDVDVASETANMTRSQILLQAGVSVLAQANQSPQIALSLIG
jgi:flagellin